MTQLRSCHFSTHRVFPKSTFQLKLKDFIVDKMVTYIPHKRSYSNIEFYKQYYEHLLRGVEIKILTKIKHSPLNTNKTFKSFKLSP